MSNSFKAVFIVTVCFLMQGCSSSKSKVTGSWKADQNVVELFKEKNVLVIARTADDHARIAFEEAIVLELQALGIQATESFKKAPKIYPNREISEERVALIKSLLSSEGYTGIVLTVIKDKEQVTSTSSSGMYVGASYGSYYPGYYGNFYNYYASPYAYGSYYNSFGGYIPLSTSTRTYNNYVLETVAYNLDEISDKQLVAVVTSDVNDPKEAYKTAAVYASNMMKSLQKIE
ncbi:MAG: hypothetical protein ACJART_002580 [Maribacter sp.]|jgi:hypothetical protein